MRARQRRSPTSCSPPCASTRAPGAAYWFGIVFPLEALGRGRDSPTSLERAPGSPWVDAALAHAAGDLVRAAEIYAAGGSLPDEAHARLRAAQLFVEQGRRADADRELGRALAFFRGVGATRHVREGEALLASTA